MPEKNPVIASHAFDAIWQMLSHISLKNCLIDSQASDQKFTNSSMSPLKKSTKASQASPMASMMLSMKSQKPFHISLATSTISSQCLMISMTAMIPSTTAAIGASEAVKVVPRLVIAGIIFATMNVLQIVNISINLPIAPTTLPIMTSAGPRIAMNPPILRIMSFISGLRFFHHLANSFSLSEHFLIIGLKLSLMVFPTSLRASFILFEATLTSPLPSSRFLYVSVTESVESARINAESDTFLKSNEPFFNAS